MFPLFSLYYNLVRMQSACLRLYIVPHVGNISVSFDQDTMEANENGSLKISLHLNSSIHFFNISISVRFKDEGATSKLYLIKNSLAVNNVRAQS